MALYDENIEIGSIVRVSTCYKLDKPFFEGMEYEIISIYSNFGMISADGVATDECKEAHPNIRLHINREGTKADRKKERYHHFTCENLGFLTLVE